MRKISIKYIPRAVVPCEITDSLKCVLEDGKLVFEGEFMTADEKVCRMYLLGTLNAARGGTIVSELDKEARKCFNMGFEDVKAAWERRIGKVRGSWDIIQMFEV